MYFRWMRYLAFCLLFGLLTPTNLCFASKKAAQKSKEYTLQELLRLAWSNSPLMKVANRKLAVHKAREKEVYRMAWLPTGSLLTLVTPAPPARGDAVRSTTPQPESFLNFSEYGALIRIDANIAWPLYTFGKLSLAQDAAKEAVRIGRAGITLEKDKLTLLLKKIYYGLQLVESSLALLDEGEGYLEDARKKAKGKTDKLKLKIFEVDLKTRLLQAKNAQKLALVALKRLAGIPMSQKIKLKEAELEESEYTILPLKKYQLMAQKNRPELKMLRHAIKAKRNLVSIRNRSLLPDFFIGGFFRYAYSNVADDQTSPFARDDFNFIEGGAGIGMRFTFDIGQKLAAVEKEKASTAVIVSQQKLVKQAVKLEVEKKYRELVMAKKMVELFRAGRKAGNKLITRTVISYSSGLVDLRELIEALLSSSRTRFGYLDALFKFYVAKSELARAVGAELDKPQK